METGCTPTQNFVQMLRLMTPPMHQEGIKKVYCSHNEVFYGEQGKLPSTSEMWLGLSWCLGGGDGVRVPACGQRLMCCVASIPASAKGRWAQVFSPTCTDMWQKGWDGGGLTVRHQKWVFDFFFFTSWEGATDPLCLQGPSSLSLTQVAPGNPGPPKSLVFVGWGLKWLQHSQASGPGTFILLGTREAC